jgi:hypothetical protein
VCNWVVPICAFNEIDVLIENNKSNLIVNFFFFWGGGGGGVGIEEGTS